MEVQVVFSQQLRRFSRWLRNDVAQASRTRSAKTNPHCAALANRADDRSALQRKRSRHSMLESMEPRWAMTADPIWVGGVYIEEGRGQRPTWRLISYHVQGRRRWYATIPLNYRWRLEHTRLWPGGLVLRYARQRFGRRSLVWLSNRQTRDSQSERDGQSHSRRWFYETGPRLHELSSGRCAGILDRRRRSTELRSE